MSKSVEKYFLHPVERPITDADAKVVIVSSEDNPIVSFFYESCFYRHDCVVCEKPYALGYDELFCFMSTNFDYHKLGATVTIDVAGKKLVVDKPCMIEIPAFVPHGPIEISNVETPIFSFVTGPGREHSSLPTQSWRPEDAYDPAEMVTYYNGDDLTNETHFNPEQEWLIRAIPGRTTKGEVIASLRHFRPAGPWDYVDGSHLHAAPEILGFYGADPWHPYELNGEYTCYVNGESVRFDKPTVVYMPSYAPHCPIAVHGVTKDNFWHSTGMSAGPSSFKPGYKLEYMNLKAGEFPMDKAW